MARRESGEEGYTVNNENSKKSPKIVIDIDTPSLLNNITPEVQTLLSSNFHLELVQLSNYTPSVITYSLFLLYKYGKGNIPLDHSVTDPDSYQAMYCLAEKEKIMTGEVLNIIDPITQKKLKNFINLVLPEEDRIQRLRSSAPQSLILAMQYGVLAESDSEWIHLMGRENTEKAKKSLVGIWAYTRLLEREKIYGPYHANTKMELMRMLSTQYELMSEIRLMAMVNTKYLYDQMADAEYWRAQYEILCDEYNDLQERYSQLLLMQKQGDRITSKFINWLQTPWGQSRKIQNSREQIHNQNIKYVKQVLRAVETSDSLEYDISMEDLVKACNVLNQPITLLMNEPGRALEILGQDELLLSIAVQSALKSDTSNRNQWKVSNYSKDIKASLSLLRDYFDAVGTM